MFGRPKNYLLFFKKLKNGINQQKYLIAPLDWGLGHATRCIPLIDYLLSLGHRVFVCGEGSVEKLIKKEFPQVEFLQLRGYRISYSKSRKMFWYKILTQLPKIALAVRRERKWLSAVINQHKIDVVISDNRLGLYNQNAYSIFMTHQLGIKTGTKFFDYFARKINYSYINRFNECWVPDIDDKEWSIAGELSHPQHFPKVPIKYIGLLSRINPTTSNTQYDIAAILSGPEPQRTIFEKTVGALFSKSLLRGIIVRGLPGVNSTIESLPPNIKQVNHLDAVQMSLLLQSSSSVVCRSGYSTVMDLLKTGKPALLVPTPGQTEQVYLAQRMNHLGFFSSSDQSALRHEDILCITSSKKINSEVFELFKKELNRLEKTLG